MCDLIPFVMADEVKQIKAEIGSKKLSIIFDGTTRLVEALAIVVCYMSGWTIQQCLIRLQLFVKSMTGEEIAREILNTISVEYGVALDRVLAVMHDRASCNAVTIRTFKSIYPHFLDTQLTLSESTSKSLF